MHQRPGLGIWALSGDMALRYWVLASVHGKQGGVEALQAARTVGGTRHGHMDSWAYRCEGAEEAVLSLTEHGDKAATVQGGL